MSKARFIAGAVCPSCRAMDRVVVEEHEGGRRRRCVACGHFDALAQGSGPTPPTRFTRAADAPAVADAVRIVEPPPRRR